MKTQLAYLCSDCDEVFERAPHSQCPSCWGENIIPLDWLRKSAQEREAWLKRIGALRPELHSLPLQRNSRKFDSLTRDERLAPVDSLDFPSETPS